jgi:hypothetical protein
MERKIGLISIIIGALWLLTFVAALFFGLTFIGGVEHTILTPLDSTLNTIDTVYKGIVDFKILGIPIGKAAEVVVKPIQTVIKEPLVILKQSIEDVFTTIKLVYAGVTTWSVLPNILLIYVGVRLRKLGPKGLRRQRKQISR